jgi:hypothetical protein
MEDLRIFTVADWRDVEPVSAAMGEGCCRIPECPAIFLDYVGVVDGSYTFRGIKSNADAHATERVELRIASKWEVCETLERIAASVRYDDGEIAFTTTTQGIALRGDGGGLKEKRFKRDFAYVYKLQKTQYRAKDPYEPLLHFIDDTFHYMIRAQFKRAGWMSA